MVFCVGFHSKALDHLAYASMVYDIVLPWDIDLHQHIHNHHKHQNDLCCFLLFLMRRKVPEHDLFNE